MNSRLSDFDQIAKWYDSFLNQLYFRALYRRAEKMLEPYITNGEKIIDIGCGTGNWLMRLSQKYKNLELYGIDKSRAMLAVSAQKNSNFRLVKGLAEKLPFHEQEFDFVSMIEALHHFDDQERSFREAARVLKSGGYFFLIDPAFDGWSALFWWSAKILPFEKTSHFVSEKEAITLIEKVGLEIVKAENKWANNWIIARKK